ncbi:MAG: BMP family ABC transporter substrate-binding protein [Armatimonadota bacterium]|nr:BMP family ABC transporter substrate-binding protein [Armatimonadota bacterium]MDR7449733.1 BMP family ABC transporter substrate-binding protein [Armatimonadota bacterium]MDR7458711.1 BMP family ABC transporter substrate-binding protein [Armatimonadota bacterium]MDR7479320.1 BMP family ABC transporter substrate-binding protein [Armatimonadota bacterium]MDR7487918.1 BMP family ABC transporter substrate-binding protein [Armatimonadota bacterium]
MTRIRGWLVLALVAVLALGTWGGMASAQARTLRIGLVYDVGGRGDLSFNDMAAAGLDRAAKTFAARIETKELEPAAGGENREELLRLLAGERYDLILGIGFLFTDSITRVARDFRAVRFAIVDGFIDKEPNVVSLLFKEEEGSFLVGAAAALKSKTNKIGFVGGMKIPLIEKFEVGYIAGAKYVKPTIQVFSDYAGTTGEAFRDPVKGKELASAQYDRGADIIYHASGGTGIGVFEAAALKRKLAIGVDADQSLTVKPEQRRYILTSMLKRVDVAVYEAIRSVVNGTFKPGIRTFGLRENGVGYAVNQYNRSMIQDIVPRLEALKRDIVAGKIKVPTTKAELEAFLKARR